MPKFIVTFEVEDREAWERGFRTHGDLFRAQSVTGEIEIAVEPGGRHVALVAEVTDPERFWAALSLPEALDAMNADGVKAETLRIHAVESRFKL